MAKATPRVNAKPNTRPAPQKTASGASGQSKAQRAAQHQGRAPEPEKRRDDPKPAQRASVPATRPQGRAPATDFGSTASLPAFMRNDAGAGKENIGREDLETPRLKLMQGLSKELEVYDGLRPGYFFHTAAEEIFDQPVKVVPLYMDRRFILWRPLTNGGGIIARADDGVNWSPTRGEFEVKLDPKDGGNFVKWKLAPTVQASGLANWGTLNPENPNSPPAATLMYTFVMAFPDLPDLMPAALTFQRSSIKMGRKFNTKLKTTRVPLYGMQFMLSSFDDMNGASQEFKNINITGAGLVEDEGLFKHYRELHLSFKEAGLTIKDIEGLQGEEATDDQGEDHLGEGRPNF